MTLQEQSFLHTGMVVVEKDTGILGRCAYSSAGLSVYGIDESGHWQTLGAPREEVAIYWRPATEEETARYFADCERLLNHE